MLSNSQARPGPNNSGFEPPIGHYVKKELDMMSANIHSITTVSVTKS